MSLWLVTFAYYSERADVYVVEAADEQAAREGAADLATPHGHDGKFVRRAVLEDSRVVAVADGVHVTQDAEY